MENLTYYSGRQNYILSQYNEIPVLFSKADVQGSDSKEPFSVFKSHDFSSSSGNKVSEIYYLRGHRKLAEHGKVLIAALEGLGTLPDDLYQMLENIEFWNYDGHGAMSRMTIIARKPTISLF